MKNFIASSWRRLGAGRPDIGVDESAWLRALRYGLAFALLVWTAPAFLQESWPWASSQDLPALLYDLTCFVALFFFAHIGIRRRLTVAVFALLFTLLYKASKDFDVVRVIFAAVVPLGVTFVYEAIRQNLPLARQLLATRERLPEEMKRTLKVWRFMLVIILAGILFNWFLGTWAQSFVYSATPIDEYCNIDGRAGDPIPCEEVDLFLGQEDLEFLPKERALQLRLEDAAVASLAGSISEIYKAEEPDLSTEEGVRRWLEATEHTFSMTDAFKDFAFGNTELVQLYARRDALRAEISRINSANAGLVRHPVAARFFGRAWGARLPPPESTLRQTQELVDIESRVQQVRRASGISWVEEGRTIDKIASNRLAALPAASAERLYEAIKDAKNHDDRRALAVAYFAGARAPLLRTAEPLLVEIEGLWPDEAIRTENQKRALAEVYIRIRSKYCSLERESTLYYDEPPEYEDRDGKSVMVYEGKPAKVNEGTFACPFALSENVSTSPVIDQTPQTKRHVSRSCRSFPLNPIECTLEMFRKRSEGELILVPVGIRDSADRSLVAWRMEQERRIHLRLMAGVIEIRAASDKSAAAAKAAADLIPHTIHLGREVCHGYLRTPGRCISNKIKHNTENGYAKQRAKAGRKYDQSVDKTQATTEAEALIAASQASHEAVAGVRQLEDWGHTTVKWVLDGSRLLAYLGWLSLAFAIFKSVLVAASIVLFDMRGIADASMYARPGPVGDIKIEKGITLPVFTGKMITKKAMTNQHGDYSLAIWPLLGILARNMTGTYWGLNNAESFESKLLSVSLDHDQHMIHWTMKPGEEVVFAWKHFFGVSDNIEIRSEVSLRLSTLPLGRVVFYVAKCKTGEVGHLLLHTKGRPSSNSFEVPEAKRTGLTELSRLVAWNYHTAFELSSQRNGLAMWWNGTSIKLPETTSNGSEGKVVIGTAAPGAVPFQNLLQCLKTAFSPF